MLFPPSGDRVSRSEAEKAFAAYQKKLPNTVNNKQRAAIKLNAKNKVVAVFKDSYNLETEDERAGFFNSPIGENAYQFFLWALLESKPDHKLPSDPETAPMPSSELEALLKELLLETPPSKISQFLISFAKNSISAAPKPPVRKGRKPKAQKAAEEAAAAEAAAQAQAEAAAQAAAEQTGSLLETVNPQTRKEEGGKP